MPVRPFCRVPSHRHACVDQPETGPGTRPTTWPRNELGSRPGSWPGSWLNQALPRASGACPAFPQQAAPVPAHPAGLGRVAARSFGTRFPVLLLTAALLLGPATTALAQELPGVLIQQGERYLAMGKYKAALARYAKVLECCPGTAEAAEAHNDSGVAWARQGRDDLAEEHYRQALTINRYPLALYNLARLQQRQAQEGRGRAQSAQLRQQARSLYAEFASWLASNAAKPPSVEYQREELLQDVRQALGELADTL